MAFHQNNHYVACMSLKHFAATSGHVLTYPILVANQRVPLWRLRSIKGIAYRAHLYTRIVAGGQTDEMETWFNKEFETPAEEALKKATEDMRLTPRDWRSIIRFVAAQDVRTPARLFEDIQRWNNLGPGLLEETLKESVRKLELAKNRGEEIQSVKATDSEYLPVRVTTRIEPGKKFGEIKAEMIVGRDLWLFGIRRLLTQTVNALLEQKWSILSPPEGLEWFTSDDPVVRLNYYARINTTLTVDGETGVLRYFYRLARGTSCTRRWAIHVLLAKQLHRAPKPNCSAAFLPNMRTATFSRSRPMPMYLNCALARLTLLFCATRVHSGADGTKSKRELREN